MNSINWWFPTCSRIERDQVGNGDEIVLLGAGEAKRKLYEVRLDPQYWYDKAIERSWEKKLLAIFFENIRCVYFCPVLFFEGKRQNTVGVGIWWRKAFFFATKLEDYGRLPSSKLLVGRFSLLESIFWQRNSLVNVLYNIDGGQIMPTCSSKRKMQYYTTPLESTYIDIHVIIQNCLWKKPKWNHLKPGESKAMETSNTPPRSVGVQEWFRSLRPDASIYSWHGCTKEGLPEDFISCSSWQVSWLKKDS